MHLQPSILPGDMLSRPEASSPFAPAISAQAWLQKTTATVDVHREEGHLQSATDMQICSTVKARCSPLSR